MKEMLSRRRFLSLSLYSAAALTLPVWLSGCAGSGSGDATASSDASSETTSSQQEKRSITLFNFDTVIQISARTSEEVMQQLADRCEYFENKFSRTLEGTDIWKINHAAGAPVEVAPETAQCISAALEYSKASDGLFDITIGAVTSLWDFVVGVKPDDAAIQEAVKHVDYHCVQVDGTMVTLTDPEAMLDLGGIAKGFITDDLVGILRDAGCESAMLSLGGNVYVLGESFRGDNWNVGVQDPNGATDDVIASVPAQNKSVVTSGLYERSFTQDGVLYYHILDPKTGYPAQTDLASASIMSDASTDGDAYSTILFLLGHDRAIDLLNSDARFSGVVVDMNDTATASAGSDFTILEK